MTEGSLPELAKAILDPERRTPIVVVTTPGYTDPAHIPQATLDEAEELFRVAGDIADVAIVATGKVSFAFEALLPDHWHVFNGFCRSYPTGILADPDIRRSPLRRRGRGEVASVRVVNDAFGHAHASGALDRKPPATIATTGTVRGFLADGAQALIDVGTTWPAIAWQDLTAPGIPLQWLIEEGATVPGELDRDRNRFVLQKPPFTAAEFHAAFPHGAVTLALVDRVSASSAVLRVHPALAITVDRAEITSNPHDVLDLFLVEGEVVRVRVVHLSTGAPHLRLIDVDDDEPVIPAVSIVRGGAPWLREGRHLPSAEHPTAAEPLRHVEAEPTSPPPDPTPVETAPPTPPPPPSPPPTPSPPPPPSPPTPTPAPPPSTRSIVRDMSMTITALTSDNDRLRHAAAASDLLRQELDLTRRTLRDTRAELGDATARLGTLRELHKKAVEELRRARKGQPAPTPVAGPRDRRDDWPDDELWLREEIRLAWVQRVQAAEKAAFALPDDYVIGPRFAASLDALDDGQFDKAMKTVVDVLTDRAKDIPGRDLHRLRTGDGGGDAAVVRPEDGASCWRAAIEIKSSSARRLHFWLVGSRVELSRVVLHDDMEP